MSKTMPKSTKEEKNRWASHTVIFRKIEVIYFLLI
jgi:hypothetical protein